MRDKAMPGKMIMMEMYAKDAQSMGNMSQDLQQAMMGKVMQTDDRVMFKDMMMNVKDTQPGGPIQINQDTAIKMEMSQQPMMMTCSNCGMDHEYHSGTCPGCGTEMQMMML